MKRKILSILAIATLTMSAFVNTSIAQDQTQVSAEETQTAQEAQTSEKSVMDMWNAGGWTMYPLGLFAVLGITLIIYNAIAIQKKKFLNPDGVKKVEAMLGQLNFAEAMEFCEKNPSPITNIVGAGLARVDEKHAKEELDLESIEKAMEESSVEELANPYVLINYLSVIASLAPMLGLFGTVSGMVKAFNTIAAEGAGSAQKLADNISEALITTASGMVIGIPTMFFFFFYKNKFGAITSSTSRIIGDLIFIMKMTLKYGPQEIEEAQEAQPKA